MANVILNNTKELLLTGSIAPLTDTLKVMLVTSSYTPDQDAHDFINDASANEVSGTGYTAGGATLAGKTITQDNTNNLAYLDATDTEWTGSTITNARYAILYKDTGNAATSPIIAIFDFGSNKSTTAEPFVITWATTGLLALA